MKNKKPGKYIAPYGANIQPHEIETAKFLNKLGKDVEFLMPSYTKGVSSPDILMDGVIWEIKSPQGESKRTIDNNYRAAQKQAQNIIFDLRRIRIDETKAISQIKYAFEHRKRRIMRIIIITKSNIHYFIDFRKLFFSA